MNEHDEPDGRPLCRLCREFNGAYRCASPLECDCPKCSGLCRCDLDAEDQPNHSYELKMNTLDPRFETLSFVDLLALRAETLRSNREIPDRTNTEFVKDIDAELKRRNDGPSIPHNRILNKPQQEKKPNGS